MRYDIIVKGFRSRSGRMVVARHLARNEGITLEEATIKTDHLPITMIWGVSREKTGIHLDRYRRLGIDAQAVPSVLTIDIAGNGALSTEQPTVPSKRGSGTRQGVRGHKRFSRSRRPVSPALIIKWTILFLTILAFILAGMFIIKNSGFGIMHRLLRGRTATSAVPNHGTHTTGVIRTEKKARSKDVSFSDNGAGRVKSFLYIDSAKASANDALDAIKFYKLAIAFNRNNVHAWYGLLDTYRATGKTKEVQATIATMRSVLGEGMFSVDAIVRPFGALLDYRQEADGSVAIEYQTKSANEHEKLLRETYLVARAVKNQCDCPAVSIFAKTSRSHGLLARIAADEPSASIADFEAHATIHFFENDSENPRVTDR